VDNTGEDCGDIESWQGDTNRKKHRIVLSQASDGSVSWQGGHTHPFSEFPRAVRTKGFSAVISATCGHRTLEIPPWVTEVLILFLSSLSVCVYSQMWLVDLRSTL
jgi:hypothetical protein